MKDDDKDKLDAASMLKTYQESQEASNEARKEAGLIELYVTGWAMPPSYNDQTHNLEWALKLRDADGNENVNYHTKLLGRKGVMNVTLVIDQQLMKTQLPIYQKMLAGFAYNSGQSYAEYRQGDKIAQYGLVGLVTAGAGFAALKTGLFGKLGLLLAKMGKLVIVAVLAVAAAVKKIVARIFGRSAEE